MGPRAWTDRPGSITRKTWRPTSSRSWIGRSPARTEHRRCGACTFPRRARTASFALSESRRWRTRFSSGRSSCCWSRSTSRTSMPARMAFVLDDRHDALEDLWKRTMDSSGGWILEVDIRKFFDTLDHSHLREFLQLRVRDGVLKRLIGKWLKAGVMESGSVSYPDAGSPQGGVISPLLANVFLHYVLDTWFRQEVQPRLRGRAHLIRYADDFVILFRHEDDARRVMEVLPKRFGKYGLTLHPEKTRLVPFCRPPHKAVGGIDHRGNQPGTFDLLGFTHYWGRTRRGGWAVMRQTVSKRLSRAVRSIAEWCRLNRHRPVCEQHTILSQKVRGHYAYYGITGNARALGCFLMAVHRAWRK